MYGKPPPATSSGLWRDTRVQSAAWSRAPHPRPRPPPHPHCIPKPSTHAHSISKPANLHPTVETGLAVVGHTRAPSGTTDPCTHVRSSHRPVKRSLTPLLTVHRLIVFSHTILVAKLLSKLRRTAPTLFRLGIQSPTNLPYQNCQRDFSMKVWLLMSEACR